MPKYVKPAITFKDQVVLIKSRGLRIDNEARTIRHLSNISYYRFSAYMLPLKKLDSRGEVLDTFIDGSTWDDVYNLYRFDRKLRLLVFDAIERIEIALRTQIIYQLSHKYGSHWQDNSAIFNNSKVFDDIQNHINTYLKSKNKVEFIDHYLLKYDDPKNPPSWMCVELLYFKQLSNICRYLKIKQDVVSLAKSFGLPSENVFCSWLQDV